MTKPPRYPYVQLTVSPDDVELAELSLWELGAQGIEQRDQGTLTRADHDASTVTLLAGFAQQSGAEAARASLSSRWPAQLTFVVGDAWRDGWREHFKPVRVGERLVVRPSWEPYEAREDDRVITIDPENAFGTGDHDTTRLVLEALDRFSPQGLPVLDVGCGSGILSIAAALLGAQSVRGVDVDPYAVETAQKNVQDNGVATRVSLSTTPIEEVSGTFPLVVANIETRVLVPMAELLMARVAPAGVLILSGVLQGEEDQLLAAYGQLRCVDRVGRGEWARLCLERQG